MELLNHMKFSVDGAVSPLWIRITNSKLLSMGDQFYKKSSEKQERGADFQSIQCPSDEFSVILFLFIIIIIFFFYQYSDLRVILFFQKIFSIKDFPALFDDKERLSEQYLNVSNYFLFCCDFYFYFYFYLTN